MAALNSRAKDARGLFAQRGKGATALCFSLDPPAAPLDEESGLAVSRLFFGPRRRR